MPGPAVPSAPAEVRRSGARRRRPRAVDAAALFVALVLVPQSFPRNRFPGLFAEDPAAARARRRAALVRGLVRVLVAPGAPRAELVRRPGARPVVRYVDDALRIRRVTQLDEHELAVLCFVLERHRPNDAPLTGCPLSGGAALHGEIEAYLLPLFGAPRRRRRAGPPQPRGA